MDNWQKIPENVKLANLSAYDLGTMFRLHNINIISAVKRV
ncbi:hypothetical protein [Enterococcus plantarum]